jgi:hypothetical protein
MESASKDATMDEDDLPLDTQPPQEPSAADSLGQSFGALFWIVALVAVVGVVAYALMHWG